MCPAADRRQADKPWRPQPEDSTPPTRIDVHSHYLPQFYQDALHTAGQTHPDGISAAPRWSEEEALQTMETLGIAPAILSVSSPGVYFGDEDAARRLARQVNVEGQRLHAARPGCFG